MANYRFKLLLVAGIALLTALILGRHSPTGATKVSRVAAHTQVPASQSQRVQLKQVANSFVASATPPQEAILSSQQGAVTDWRNFVPENLIVQLRPDLALPFHVIKVERANGRTVLTARITKTNPNEPDGLDMAFYVSTANAADSYEALVALPGEEYHIHVDRSGTTVEQTVLTDWNCGAAKITPVKPPAAMQSSETAQPATAGMVVAADGQAPTVDVLFIASADTLAFRSLNLVDADCSNFMAAGNAVLQNSQITNFQWRYLGVVAAPAYTTDTKIITDFNLFTQSNGNVLNTFANQKQVEYGADQMVLLTGEKTDYGGLGECPGHRCAIMFPANGFPVDANGNYTVINGVTQQGPVVPSYMTTIHELGHGFGCHHDRATEKAADGNGQYYYGYVFKDATDTRYPPTSTGTIMSYTAPFIPNFSNPNVTYHGYATGVPIDQPTAAYNAKVIMDDSPAMVATMNPPGAPTITQQPKSVTVTSGNSFTLSVTASGNGTLTYQWLNGGQSIVGAVSSTYSVTAALTGDAGQYTVTVTNSIGSTTSSAATVTVNPASNNQTPPVNQGSTGSSSGGGGGGGAPSFWFYGALGLLLLLRGMTNRNQWKPHETP